MSPGRWAYCLLAREEAAKNRGDIAPSCQSGLRPVRLTQRTSPHSDTTLLELRKATRKLQVSLLISGSLLNGEAGPQSASPQLRFRCVCLTSDPRPLHMLNYAVVGCMCDSLLAAPPMRLTAWSCRGRAFRCLCCRRGMGLIGSLTVLLTAVSLAQAAGRTLAMSCSAMPWPVTRWCSCEVTA